MSIWSDIHKRSNGDTIRKEDDINLLDIDGVLNYINNNYNSYAFSHFSEIEPFIDINQELIIPLMERRSLLFTLNYIMGECATDPEFKNGENVILLSASVENYMRGLYLMLNDTYTIEKIKREDKFTSYIRIMPKDISTPVTNSFLIEVIDFILENANDPRDKKLVKRSHTNESIWSDIHKRSNGEKIRKEDDVNHMDFNTFVKYIEDTYSENSDWFTVVESLDNKTRHIQIDVISGITLSFNVIDGKLYNILVEGVPGHIDIQALKEIFNVNILGSGTVSVVEKDWTKSNNTFVKLIEFFIDMKTNESVWSDIHKRSNGNQIRKEDDVNLMDIDSFYEYLESRYEGKIHYMDKDVYGSENKRNIVVDVLKHVSLYTKYDGSGKMTHILLSWSIVHIRAPFIDFGLGEKFELQHPNPCRITITEKDGTCTNQTYIDVIDYFLDHINEVLIEGVSESVWSDIHKRSNGRDERKEDTFDFDKLERVKNTDLQLFANDIVFCENCDNSIDGFKTFVKQYDYRFMVRGSVFLTIDELISYVERNWQKEHFGEFVDDLINEKEQEISKMNFKKEPGKSIDRTLNDWWNSLDGDERYEVLLGCGIEDHSKFEKYSDDELWEDLDYFEQMNAYMKYNKMNESVWSDIHKRSNGEQVRKEDILTEDELKSLDQYIVDYANVVIYGWCRGTDACDLDEFCEYLDDRKIDAKFVNYVKANWADELSDDVLGTIEQIEKEYHESMYESVWSDIHKRSNGDKVRKEDEMDSDDFIMLRETAKMFRNLLRGDGKILGDDDEVIILKDNSDDFVKYIESLKSQHFWHRVDDEQYDKCIRFVKMSWGECKGIQEFIDTYLINLNECEGVPGGATPTNVGGMGAAYFPGPNGEPGSGDLPSPTGIVYQQVAPFAAFIKQGKKKKKKKKFRKEDEPCVHSPNAKVYDYVDDFREYVDRTYNNMDRR